MLKLSKSLSNKFLVVNSLTKKSYKNNSEFQEIITKHIAQSAFWNVLGKSYKVARTYFKSDLTKVYL